MPIKQLATRYAVKSVGMKYVDFQDKVYKDDAAKIDLIDKKYKEFMTYENIFPVGDDKTYTLDELIGDYPN